MSATGGALDVASQTSVEADGEYEGSESDLDWEPAQDVGGAFQTMASTESNLGTLFEHYSLFQSEPGTWCSAQGENSHAASDELPEDTVAGCDDHLSGPNLSILPENHMSDGCGLRTWSGADAAASVGPPRADAARALFDQYALFGAEPGAWSKDNDCSTGCSSEIESAEVTEEAASDVSSADDEMNIFHLDDLIEQ